LSTLTTTSADLAGDQTVILRAEAVHAAVGAASNEIESTRRLPPALLDKLHEAGLFRLLLPRSSNGIETDPVTFFHVIETIAHADGSTAWCLSQAGGCAMAAAYLDLPVAHAIFGNDPRAVVAWGPGPKVRAIACDGGYRVTGVWSFNSGGRHATWLGAHCPIYNADGSPMLDTDGDQRERTMLVRAEDVEWTDIWNTVGLRGTASDQFALDDYFVRSDHSITREFDRECRESGPLYRMSSGTCYQVGFAGVACGIARGALDCFIDLARNKVARGYKGPLRDNAVVQSNLAQAEANSAPRAPWCCSRWPRSGRTSPAVPPSRSSSASPSAWLLPTPSTRRARRLISLTIRRGPPRFSKATRWSAASAISTPSPSSCKASSDILKPSAPG
jgi:indole-3-acetate monooxygenase